VSEPVLVMESRKTSPAMARHPLATLTGIEMMIHLTDAGRIWRGCTKPQRALLDEVCPPLVARLRSARELLADELPALDLPARRMEALRRRGLVDDTGRLTAKAVHTYHWTHLPPRHRPIVDVHLPEEA
jgi:hypothetical protein